MARVRTAPREKRKRFEKEIRSELPIMEHGDRDSRARKWEKLKGALDAYMGRISQGLASELNRIQLAEEDGNVAFLASRIMHTVIFRSQPGTRRQRAVQTPKSLGEWLWDGFHEPSYVLRVADPGRHRRDEDAVIEIARSLSLTDFPHTEFLCVDSHGFDPEVAELEKVGAFCFVGRMSLFGKAAVKSWNDQDHSWRYCFAMEPRPSKLPRGQLHPKYHAVLEHPGETGDKRTYRTEETKTKRTDYGLIRRYVVSCCGRCRVVVHIAGCSSLGTQAAAHFAAHSLFVLGLNEELVPTPPGVNSKSSLEALIQVNAKTAGSQFGWKLRDLELLYLRVGNFMWNEKKFLWEPASRAEITVTFANATARRDYLKDPSAAEIVVGEDLAKFHDGSENGHLCLALCMLAAKQKGTVPLDDLANNRQIWGDNQPKSVNYVANRLRSIKQLKNMLVIDNGACRVLSKIHIKVRNPNKPR